MWCAGLCLALAWVQGCSLPSSSVSVLPPRPSPEAASLRQDIFRQTEALQYPPEVAHAFADMVLSWREAGQPTLVVCKALLDQARSQAGQGMISPGELVRTERLIVTRLSRRIRDGVQADDASFDLADVVRRRRANCLGVTQVFWIAARSAGLSVRPVHVAELQEQGPLPDGARHICCMVAFKDGTAAMVNLAPPSFTSRPFVVEHVYRVCGHALKLADRGNSLGVYRRIQLLDPNGLIAHVVNSRAAALVSQDRPGAALDLYIAATGLNPLFAEAWNNYGIALSRCGDPNGALSAYNHAVELDPDCAEAFNNRALVSAELGQFQQAFSDYAAAERLHPLSAQATCNRATAYHQLGEFDRAVREYARAIHLDPGLAQAYFNRANAYTQLGEYEKAISDYTQAIRLNPRMDEAYVNRGATFAALGRPDAARRDLRLAMELSPSPARAQLIRRVSDRAGLVLFSDPLP